MTFGNSGVKGKRKPLGVVDKIEVLSYWIEAEPSLPSAALRVLIYLVKCQNTKTGACFPSSGKIASAIKMTKRSVLIGLKILKDRGAICVMSRPGKSNIFVIFSVAELDERQFAKRDEGVETDFSRSEISGRKGVKATSTINTKRNNKRKLEKGLENRNIPYGQFEKSLTAIVERQGFDLHDIVKLPARTVEGLHERLRTGELNFSEAVSMVLDLIKADHS